jgi:hypothetical protein
VEVGKWFFLNWNKSNFVNKYGDEEDNECIFCYKLKHELDLALHKLSSVKKDHSDIARRKEFHT